MVSCSQCGVLGSKKPLFRNNKLGVEGDFRCLECLDYPEKVADDLLDLCNIIVKTNYKNLKGE